jgi:hypothetical protein
MEELLMLYDEWMVSLPCNTDDGWRMKRYDMDPITGKEIVVWWCGDVDNLEDIDDEWPSDGKINRRWRWYWSHVIQTGEDPLDQVYVKREYTRQTRWQFRAARGLAPGTYVVVRRNGRGKWVALGDAPEFVKEWFDYQECVGSMCRSGYTLDTYRASEACKIQPRKSNGRRVQGYTWVTETVARSEKEIVKDIRRIAWSAFNDLV